MAFLLDITRASMWAVNAIVSSATGGKVGHQEVPPKVVLVPPLFERDLRLRSRMAHSSYDFLFAKPAMRWLLNDYMNPGYRGWLHFRPAEDLRLSVSADLHGGSTEQLGRDTTGSLTMRYQPDPEDPLSFFDVRGAARGGGMTRARACWFSKETGVGAWGVVPLVAGEYGKSTMDNAEVGLRYSTPAFTAGAIVSPASGVLNQIWMCGHNGNITWGAQTEPRSGALAARHLDQEGLQRFWQDCRDSMSYCVAYTPDGATPYVTAAGRGSFTAAIELRKQRQLVISFLYHMAVQRNVRNPFETQEVVGITNYIDLGLQVVTDMVDGPAGGNGTNGPERLGGAPGSAALGAAWQVNKSVLVKGRLSTDSVGASVAVKSWWNPSSTAAVSCTYPFGAYNPYPKLGLTFGCENFGNIRYERSKDRSPQGSSIVQRHVAQPADIRNHEGKGVLVQLEDMDNPSMLGQQRRQSDMYL